MPILYFIIDKIINNKLLNYPTIPAGTLLLVGGTKIKFAKAILSMAPLMYNYNVFVQHKICDFIINYLLVAFTLKLKIDSYILLY